MGKVHPDAWGRMGYEDGKAGRSSWPPDVDPDGDCTTAHDRECVNLYKSEYLRGAKQRVANSDQR